MLRGCWVGVFVLIAGARHRWNIGCWCWVGVLGTSVVEGLGFVVGLGYRSCTFFVHFVFFSVFSFLFMVFFFWCSCNNIDSWTMLAFATIALLGPASLVF